MNEEHLKQKLSENEYDYQAYVDYIAILRDKREAVELDRIRMKFHELYILTEAEWQLWIADVKLEDVTGSTSNKKLLFSLFTEAVKEHPVSVKLWSDFLQHLLDDFKECSAFGETSLCNPKEMNSIFERALNCAGWHLVDGHVIWKLYRTFLEILEPRDSLDIDLFDVFLRQIKIPHKDLESTFICYSENETKMKSMVKKNPIFQSAFKRSKEEWLMRQELEKQLIETSMSEASIYAYLTFEKKSKHPDKLFLIQALFERILESFPFSLDIWIDYTSYMDVQFAIPSLSVDLYRRAVKCIPWSSSLWAGYIHALERLQDITVEATIFTLCQQAIRILKYTGMNTVFDLVTIKLSLLEYLFRKTSSKEEYVDLFRKHMEEALQDINSISPSTADPSCTLEMFWAAVEAKRFGNIDKTRDLYDNVILKRRSFESEVWLEYIQLERYFGNIKKCFSIFKRACSVHMDNAERIFEKYLTFSREEGTLEDYYHAYGCIQYRRNHINEFNQRQLQIDEQQGHQLNPSRSGQQKRTRQIAATSDGDEKTNLASSSVSEISNKRTKCDVNPMNETVPIDHENARTVFVSNLDYLLAESDLESVFKKFGEIEKIELARDPLNNHFKGFGHVVFKDQASSRNALDNDRILIKNRPAFISPFGVKKSRDPTLKYHTEKEKTVFISNLPRDISDIDVRNLFEAYGQIDGLSLLKSKDGKPRGLAYVEFGSAEAAVSSLKAHDLLFKDKKLKVVISAVPYERATTSTSTSAIPSSIPTTTLVKMQPRQIFRSRALRIGNFETKKSKLDKKTTDEGHLNNNEEFRQFLSQ